MAPQNQKQFKYHHNHSSQCKHDMTRVWQGPLRILALVKVIFKVTFRHFTIEEIWKFSHNCISKKCWSSNWHQFPQMLFFFFCICWNNQETHRTSSIPSDTGSLSPVFDLTVIASFANVASHFWRLSNCFLFGDYYPLNMYISENILLCFVEINKGSVWQLNGTRAYNIALC